MQINSKRRLYSPRVLVSLPQKKFLLDENKMRAVRLARPTWSYFSRASLHWIAKEVPFQKSMFLIFLLLAIPSTSRMWDLWVESTKRVARRPRGDITITWKRSGARTSVTPGGVRRITPTFIAMSKVKSTVLVECAGQRQRTKVSIARLKATTLHPTTPSTPTGKETSGWRTSWTSITTG